MHFEEVKQSKFEAAEKCYDLLSQLGRGLYGYYTTIHTYKFDHTYIFAYIHIYIHSIPDPEH